ncbi:MAG: type I DNA topoisomerase [Candidatus Promineifilaceae bacterium]|nr:type I DNA topoisomerase [Candidatus Promineifilaceae bacterium]
MNDALNIEGYCLRCKEKRIIENPRPVWAANGSPATRGTCPVCGTNMYKVGRTEAHESLPKPEKKEKRSGKLVIVESPAKARTIGRYLGRNYKVMSSVGHIRDLLKSRLSVDVANDYEPEYRVPNDKRKVVKKLKAAGAKAEEIYLATDPDREGEAIAWHVREAAEMEPDRTRRVVFQEITKPAIQAAFEHPRDIDMARVDAQQARRILDRLVGYKLSPLLWRKVRGRLSAGRVQSVAVRLVVEREREIEAFEPEEYWSIEAEVSQQPNGAADDPSVFMAKLHKLNGEDLVLDSESVVQPHLRALNQADWTVTEVRLGTRRRQPTAPFTTSTLQQEASRKLRFGANKTMRIAQQLYEGVELGDEEEAAGLITYMRTDSVQVAAEAQNEARAHIVEHFGQAYVPDEPPTYKTKSKTAQEAHEAVRPTSVERSPKKIKRFLSRDQYRLYRLIWERFVASQMAPAIYDTISVDIMAGDPGSVALQRPYLFRAAGSVLRFAGFLALYEETRPTDRPEESEHEIPTDLKEAEELDLLQLLPEQHFTQPPPRFSEATLVKELEENGIGRPSTYASIISTILSRRYVEYDDRRLKPTDIGVLVTDLLVEHFPDVMSVDFTARMEDELDEIVEGKNWVPVIDSFYTRFAKRLSQADEAIEKMDVRSEPEPVGRECPECGNALVYRDGRYGRFIGCSNFPKCRHTEQILNKIGVICPKDGGELVEKRTRRGRVFYGCANYPDCDWTSWKRPLSEPCPNCGGLLVQANKNESECTQCGERHDLTVPQSDKETEAV